MLINKSSLFFNPFVAVRLGTGPCSSHCWIRATGLLSRTCTGGFLHFWHDQHTRPPHTTQTHYTETVTTSIPGWCPMDQWGVLYCWVLLMS